MRNARISAIAIASHDTGIKAAPATRSIIQNLIEPRIQWSPWLVRQWADAGDEQFVKLKIHFRALPPILYGAEWLQTSSQAAKISGNAKAQFTVSKDADVYVSYERSLTKPQWLSDFSDTKDTIENSEGTIYAVYKKRFLRNDTVHLEQNQSDKYSVFAVSTSTMEPAYDLKPITSYKASKAKLSGTVLAGMVDGKERAIFSTASAGNEINWEISIGAADIYSLTISYNNPVEKTVKGKLQFFAGDGTLIKEEDANFISTKPGKSNYINSSTGTMINAGNYKVRLTSNTAKGLSINSLDIQ